MTLDGIKVKQMKRFADERGFFMEVMRSDWKDIFEGDLVQQVNLSVTYPNTIRAWHKHERSQVDYFVVIRGAIKICAFDDNSKELDEIISTWENPQIVRIPGNYWHGFKVLGNEPATLVYFVNKLYDYDKPDEVRRPWNDEAVVPTSINGKKDDPRCNKPWNWLEPPHR
jgi:dTDP-4-dehydrorhamnose 3,5-epimerase